MEASNAETVDNLNNETDTKSFDINFVNVKEEFIPDNDKEQNEIDRYESASWFGYLKEEPQDTDEDYKVNIHELVTSDFVLKEESLSDDECFEDDKLMVPKVVVNEEHTQMKFQDNVEANIRDFYCKECEEEYEGYCPKCPMLSFILHSNVSKMDYDRPKKTIPRNILEVRDTAGSVGVYALRTIPKDVIFGPFEGLISVQSTSGNEWKMKSGKLICTENTNWMQYIRCADNVTQQNLTIFQYGNNMYYRSDQEIDEDDELLVRYCEGRADNSISDKESYYRPVVVEELRKVYACMFCCLGFNSDAFLVEHKMHCHMEDDIKEIIQCSYCDIYLCEGEYLQHQQTCSGKRPRNCINEPDGDSSAYHPKTAAERARDYRARKRIAIQTGSASAIRFRPKTAAERSRDYRARKRAAREAETASASRAQPKTAAEHSRNYRARKRAAKEAEIALAGRPQPKTAAEHSRNYRARKRAAKEAEIASVRRSQRKTAAERSRDYRARKKNKESQTLRHDEPEIVIIDEQQPHAINVNEYVHTSLNYPDNMIIDEPRVQDVDVLVYEQNVLVDALLINNMKRRIQNLIKNGMRCGTQDRSEDFLVDRE